MRDRFEREAQTISNLNHPHICILHDVGCHDGVDYLVMEYQVIVQSFPDPAAGKWQVSTNAGTRPRWRADGKELYYLDRASRLVAVSLITDQKFEVGKSAPLFQVGLGFQAPPVTIPYDVTPDAQRFIISEPGAGGPLSNNSSPLTVVLNWTSVLKR